MKKKTTIKYVIMFFGPTGLSDLTNFLETFQVLADFLEDFKTSARQKVIASPSGTFGYRECNIYV